METKIGTWFQMLYPETSSKVNHVDNTMATRKRRRLAVATETFDVFSSCLMALNVTNEEIENFTESGELPGK